MNIDNFAAATAGSGRAGEDHDDWQVDGPSAVASGSSHGFTGRKPIVSSGAVAGAGDAERPQDRVSMANLSAQQDRQQEKMVSRPSMQGVLHVDWPEDDGEWPEPANKAKHALADLAALPHPALILPTPSLSIDFRMAVSLNPRVSVGMTPLGHRNWISFTGGSWAASFGSGIVLPGGQDSQIIVPNGSARIETTYLLATGDAPPAHIVVRTEGWRTGSAQVLEALADPERADGVDPRSYSFRLFIRLETGDERYADRINYGMWVGSGMRKDREVIYE